MKALSYLRFSTPEQEIGDSTRRQLQAAHDYCSRTGLELDEDLSIADKGLSGYKGEHLKKGALGVFRAAALEGKFAGYALVIEQMDRLSRLPFEETFDLVREIVKSGVEIHDISDGQILRPGFANDMMKIMNFVFKACKSADYSKNLTERVGKSWKAKKQNAINGLAISPRAPAWLHAEFDRGTRTGKPITVIPDRAATLKRIFELAAHGVGCKNIVNTLVKEGRQPFEKGKQGRNWTPGYIQKTLHSRAALGEYQPHRMVNGKRVPDGEPIANFYPAVVSQSLFDTVQEKVKAKDRNQGKESKIDKLGRLNHGGGVVGGGKQSVNSILSPLVYDSDRLMYFHQKKGDHAYLMTKWAPGRPQHYIRYDRVEIAFLSFLEDLNWKEVAGHGESAEVIAATAQLEAVLVEVDRSSRKIDQLQKLVDDGTFSASLFEVLDAEKAKLVDAGSRKDKLATAVASARSKVQALHSPEQLIEVIRSGNPELRLRLKNEIAKRVARIDIEFGEDRKPVRATIRLINGWKDFILFKH